jgi:glutathione S-transferase
MTSLPLTSLVTLLVLVLLIATAMNVGRARMKYGIKAPAVSGNELFERAFRIQMNTLENVVGILPALWLYAAFIGDRGAAVAGMIWLAARVWYAIAYQADPNKRGGGFGVAFLTFIGLWAGALWGVVKVLTH